VSSYEIVLSDLSRAEWTMIDEAKARRELEKKTKLAERARFSGCCRLGNLLA